VNKEIYIDTLRCLRDAVRRKHPKIWGTNSWFLPHDSAPVHQSVVVKNFLVKNNMTMPGACPILS